jgi:hypothetical protein
MLSPAESDQMKTDDSSACLWNFDAHKRLHIFSLPNSMVRLATSGSICS